MMSISRFRFLFFAESLIFLGGCATRTHVFPDHQASDVWRAMIAAAETPDYHHPDPTERWTVRENNVWINDDENRIEIHREVERELMRPGAIPRHEQRQWRFQAVLEGTDPPTVRFNSRGLGVPAHAWIEAERFFDDVSDILGGQQAAFEDGARPATAPGNQ